MDRFKVMRQACFDELLKIAGELQGMVRSGRRPITVEHYLEREEKKTETPSQVLGGGEGTEKTAKGTGLPPKAALPLVVGGMAAGGLGYHGVRQANEDRKLGKQIRIQQRGF